MFITRPLRSLALLALAVCACAPSGGGVEAERPRPGKGDATDAPCNEGEYANAMARLVASLRENPVTGPRTDGADDLVDVTRHEVCDTVTAYGVWVDAFHRLVTDAFLERGRAARAAYEEALRADDPDLDGLYEEYVASLAVTEGVLERVSVLGRFRPLLDGRSELGAAYRRWYEGYEAALESMARVVSSGPLRESIAEAYMELNTSELAWLELLEAASPPRDGVLFDDGSYGHWFGEYHWYLLKSTGRALGFDLHQGSVEFGPSDIEVAFLERFAGVRPKTAGPLDSGLFMGEYARLVTILPEDSSAGSGRYGLVRSADLLEEVAPAVIRGALAYTIWLDEYVEASDAQRGRLADHKPCADRDEVAALYERTAEVADGQAHLQGLLDGKNGIEPRPCGPSLTFVGHCAWGPVTTRSCEYRAGHAVAAFFREPATGEVFVDNYLAEEPGSLCDPPATPAHPDSLQVVTGQDRSFRWDDGLSEIAFTGRPTGEVGLATSTRNRLEAEAHGVVNIYAPCFFVE